MHKFIVVDGIDGAGKSTIIEFLKKLFEEHNLPIKTAPTIGTSDIGKAIRTSIINNAIPVSEAMEMLAMAACQPAILNDFVLPNIKDNNIILDRYIPSFYAYQVVGLNNGIAKDLYINILSKPEVMEIIPDLYIYCDVSLDVSMERVIERGIIDKFDNFAIEKRERVLDGYNFHATTANNPVTNFKRIIKIDCNLSLEEVYKQVTDIFYSEILKGK